VDELMRNTVLRGLWMLAYFLCACVPHEPAQTVSVVPMVEANWLYEKGRYAEAAERYQALVDAGLAHAHLFYNLGNAYFRSGDLGRAVLNYQRAQRLSPRDLDIRANLTQAQAQTQDNITAEDTGAAAGLLRRLFEYVTPHELALRALIGWFALCSLLTAAILVALRRQLLLYASGIVAILALGSVLSAGIRLVDENKRPPAVVVVDRITLRSGPGESYLAEFTLHAGAPVRVLEQRAGWARILLPGELQGWAPAAAFEQVIPPG
jgi:tetratricopeptide (TPR) repeat protein